MPKKRSGSTRRPSYPCPHPPIQGCSQQKWIRFALRWQISSGLVMGDVELMQQPMIITNFMKCSSQSVSCVFTWESMNHHSLRLPYLSPPPISKWNEVWLRHLHQVPFDILRNSLENWMFIYSLFNHATSESSFAFKPLTTFTAFASISSMSFMATFCNTIGHPLSTITSILPSTGWMACRPSGFQEISYPRIAVRSPIGTMGSVPSSPTITPVRPRVQQALVDHGTQLGNSKWSALHLLLSVSSPLLLLHSLTWACG